MPTQPKSSAAYADRSYSFTSADRPNIARPSSRPSQPSPSSSVTRRAPIVYPALLSRVAEAFKSRVPLSDRAKDGLTYAGAFDGREAVAVIADIIKTTDRNLALLLGRALDAQKFFHDVTYDHRLRDSPMEIYQFRERLGAGSGFVSGEDGSIPEDRASVLSEEGSSTPSGVFTLLTDCYSPTCTRDRLCYSIACPRRLEQQARLGKDSMSGAKTLKRQESAESLGDEPVRLFLSPCDSVVDDVTCRSRERSGFTLSRKKWSTPSMTGKRDGKRPSTKSSTPRRISFVISNTFAT
jgi:hypothetical protein